MDQRTNNERKEEEGRGAFDISTGNILRLQRWWRRRLDIPKCRCCCCSLVYAGALAHSVSQSVSRSTFIFYTVSTWIICLADDSACRAHFNYYYATVRYGTSSTTINIYSSSKSTLLLGCAVLPIRNMSTTTVAVVAILFKFKAVLLLLTYLVIRLFMFCSVLMLIPSASHQYANVFNPAQPNQQRPRDNRQVAATFHLSIVHYCTVVFVIHRPLNPW